MTGKLEEVIGVETNGKSKFRQVVQEVEDLGSSGKIPGEIEEFITFFRSEGVGQVSTNYQT